MSQVLYLYLYPYSARLLQPKLRHRSMNLAKTKLQFQHYIFSFVISVRILRVAIERVPIPQDRLSLVKK